MTKILQSQTERGKRIDRDRSTHSKLVDRQGMNAQEVEEGAFFDTEEIRRRLSEQPKDFTPHFRSAFGRLPIAE